MFSADRLVIDFVTNMNSKPCMGLKCVTVVVFVVYDIVVVVFGSAECLVCCV